MILQGSIYSIQERRIASEQQRYLEARLCVNTINEGGREIALLLYQRELGVRSRSGFLYGLYVPQHADAVLVDDGECITVRRPSDIASMERCGDDHLFSLTANACPAITHAAEGQVPQPPLVSQHWLLQNCPPLPIRHPRRIFPTIHWTNEDRPPTCIRPDV